MTTDAWNGIEIGDRIRITFIDGQRLLGVLLLRPLDDDWFLIELEQVEAAASPAGASCTPGATVDCSIHDVLAVARA